MKIDKFKLKKIILNTVRGDQSLYIDSQIWLQVQFLIPSPLRVSYLIWFSLDNLGPPLVDYLNHHLSACPIEHPHKPSVSWSDQDNTVQESSPKYSMRW